MADLGQTCVPGVQPAILLCSDWRRLAQASTCLSQPGGTRRGFTGRFSMRQTFWSSDCPLLEPQMLKTLVGTAFIILAVHEEINIFIYLIYISPDIIYYLVLLNF